jgi:hypothetical protein
LAVDQIRCWSDSLLISFALVIRVDQTWIDLSDTQMEGQPLGHANQALERQLATAAKPALATKAVLKQLLRYGRRRLEQVC